MGSLSIGNSSNGVLLDETSMWAVCLPRECLEMIAEALPSPASVLRVMGTCKAWRRDLSEETFWQRMSHRYHGTEAQVR